MTLAQLLGRTALRYNRAVERVLKTWTSDCGCDRPGSQPHCEACPCCPVFENLVREEIQSIVRQESEEASP